MSNIRITKIFRFEMAHSLWNHEGKCKNIHGHSYILHVTLTGDKINAKGNPDDGMIIDFGKLKNIIKNNIIDIFDHSFIINENSPQSDKINGLSDFDNIIKVPFQPTSENLICHFAELIKKSLPNNTNLYSLKLSETDSSYVEWFEKY
jgi:6-pyruvoyltetrahydropterin/6-carboxytetrahydropterin synthase